MCIRDRYRSRRALRYARRSRKKLGRHLGQSLPRSVARAIRQRLAWSTCKRQPFRLGSRSSELISNSTSADASKNSCFKGRLETVSPSESTELQRKRRSRERI